MRNNWPSLAWAGFVLLGFLVGFWVVKSKALAFAPLFLLFAYVVFSNPRFGAYLFLFLAIVYFNFARNEFPALSPTRFLVEVVPVILFARAAVEAGFKGRWRTPPAALFFLLWFLEAGISAYFGQIPLEQFVLKARVFWRFFLFYWAVVNLEFDRKTVRNLAKWALGLASLNILFVAKQYQVFGISDYTKGLTGGSGELLFLVLWASAFLLALHSYRVLKARWVFPWLGAFLVLPFFNGVRAMLFYYPLHFLLLLALLALDGWRRAWSGIKLLSSLLLTAAALVALVPSLNFLWRYFMRTVEFGLKVQAVTVAPRGHAGRFVVPKLAHQALALGGFYHLLFGYGFGLFVLTSVETLFKQAEFQAVSSYLPVTLYETGYLGTALFVAAVVAAGWQSFRAWRWARDGWEKAFALSAVMVAVHFLSLLPYYWVWYEHIATSTFWAFSGLAAVLYYSSRDERANRGVPLG